MEDIILQHQHDWFHPNNTNAIYATLPKKEDFIQEEIDGGEEGELLLDDFHRYRHLSRHERLYREQNGLDLQPHWDGIYVFDDDDDDDEDELEDDEIDRIEDDNTTTRQSTNTDRKSVV